MELDYELLNDVGVCILLLFLTFGLFLASSYTSYYNQKYCKEFGVQNEEDTQLSFVKVCISVLGVVSGILTVIKIVATVFSTM